MSIRGSRRRDRPIIESGKGCHSLSLSRSPRRSSFPSLLRRSVRVEFSGVGLARQLVMIRGDSWPFHRTTPYSNTHRWKPWQPSVFWWKGGGDNTHWQPRTLSTGRSAFGWVTRKGAIGEKKNIYNNPIEWASHAPKLVPFSALPYAHRITHWCYNPLVLRRRTCCPVSNTLFFFSFLFTLGCIPPWRFMTPDLSVHPYAHLAADRNCKSARFETESTSTSIFEHFDECSRRWQLDFVPLFQRS